MRARWGAMAIAAFALLSSGCGGQPKGRQQPFPEQVTDFHTLYDRNCAGCHGANGMQGPAPRLNDPVYLAVADRQTIYNTIKYGRPGTTMPALGAVEGGPLAEKQIAALVDGMEKEWARPVDFKGAAVPTYSLEKAPAGDVRNGQKAYQRNCMMCHGFGSFKGVAGPILDPHYLALASDQGLRTTMIVGRPDWGMPDWRHRIPGHPMADQEISDVVAWLASQRPNYAALATPRDQPAPHPPAPSISPSEGQAQSRHGR